MTKGRGLPYPIRPPTSTLYPVNRSDLPTPVGELVDRLAGEPGVVAVTFVGSRPDGTASESWDLAVYYRDESDPATLASFNGTVAALGDWGRTMNGGARLEVDGLEVNLLFRDLEIVEHWIAEAAQGRFEVDDSHVHMAGVATYTLAAELALGNVLTGSLDHDVDYPAPLAHTGASYWARHASLSLEEARLQAERGDLSGVSGHLARAAIQAAHARLCRARRWIVNEKEILERAELTHIDGLLRALDADPATLLQRVMQARALLDL